MSWLSPCFLRAYILNLELIQTVKVMSKEQQLNFGKYTKSIQIKERFMWNEYFEERMRKNR